MLFTVTFDNYLKASIIGGYKFEGFMDLACINVSNFDPGYKITMRSWLKESFQIQLQPFWKHSGQTSMMEKQSFCNITVLII